MRKLLRKIKHHMTTTFSIVCITAVLAAMIDNHQPTATPLLLALAVMTGLAAAVCYTDSVACRHTNKWFTDHKSPVRIGQR